MTHAPTPYDAYLPALTPNRALTEDQRCRIQAVCRLNEYERDRAWFQQKIEATRVEYARAKAEGDEHLSQMEQRGVSEKTRKKVKSELDYDLAWIAHEGNLLRIQIELLERNRAGHLKTLGLTEGLRLAS